MKIIHRKIFQIIVTSAFCCLAACSPTGTANVIPQLEIPQTLPPEVVVFVPGFEGTELRDAKNGKPVWITARQAVLNGDTLAISHSELGLRRSGRELVVGNVLTKVQAFFGFYKYDVYSQAFQNLRAALPSNIPIISFGYDWRSSDDTSAKQLADLIAELKSRGAQRIDIVSHSMGGLIVWYYMRYGSQPIETAVENWQGAKELHSVVFAAVPFRGAIKMFHDLQTGIETGFNTSLLSSEALSTFDSCYQMMPGPDQESLLAGDMSSQDGEMHDVRNWEDQEWGLFKGKSKFSEATLNNRYTFTEQELSKAAEFTNLMTAPRVSAMPALPVLVLTGIGQPTMARSIWIPEKRRLIFSAAELTEYNSKLSSDALFRDGDSIVPADSASAPAAISKEEYVVNCKLQTDHYGIINSQAAASAILKFIRGAVPK